MVYISSLYLETILRIHFKINYIKHISLALTKLYLPFKVIRSLLTY